MNCAKCHTTLPNLNAKFCPVCGNAVNRTVASPAATNTASTGTSTASVKPISHATPPVKHTLPATAVRLEHRATLMHWPFFVTAGTVLAGSLVASEGYYRVGIGLLSLGLFVMMIVIFKSLYSGK